MGRNSPKFSKQTTTAAPNQQLPNQPHQRKRRGPRSKLSRDSPSNAPNELFVDGYEVTLASVADKAAYRASMNRAQTAASPKGEPSRAVQAPTRARQHHVNPETVPYHAEPTYPQVKDEARAKCFMNDLE